MPYYELSRIAPTKKDALHLPYMLDDDLGMVDQVNKIRAAFEKGYSCETILAPKMPASKYSREMVRGFLEDWMADQDDGESLLVVYYGCHGGDDRAG